MTDEQQKLQEGVYNIVGGDIAEFGVRNGTTALAIAEAMSKHDDSSVLHLFDSFKGLPKIKSKVDKKCPMVRDGSWKKGKCHSQGADFVLNRVTHYLNVDRVKIYEGWFKNTVEKIDSDVRFGMVHIDCDLYLSAYEVLDYLFGGNHLLKGCALFFDDWNSNGASDLFGERRAWLEIVDKYAVCFDDCGEYGYVAKKFVIN